MAVHIQVQAKAENKTKPLFGVDVNWQWLSAAGNDSCLVLWWRMHPKPDLYARTSCDVTAAAMRDHMPGTAWRLLEDEKGVPRVPRVPRFQIAFGETWDSTDHICTVWDGQLVQSYYDHYEPRAEPWTRAHEAALASIHERWAYKLVAGVDAEHPTPAFRPFFLVPVASQHTH